MKSLFYSCVSKFNVLVVFCIFGIQAFSIPAYADSKEVCTKTSSGQVVCGTPVEKPVDGSTSNSQDYPTQVSTIPGVAFTLMSCAREKHNIISCIVSFNTDKDIEFYLQLSHTKLVDNEGYEYASTKVISLKRVASSGRDFTFKAVPNVTYKATISFGNVPDSAKYATLLQLTIWGNTGGLVQFRNLPFKELDGSISEVPLPPRHKTDITDTQPSIKKPKVCLPVVGCL